jgi:hypothetical protein
MFDGDNTFHDLILGNIDMLVVVHLIKNLGD